MCWSKCDELITKDLTNIQTVTFNRLSVKKFNELYFDYSTSLLHIHVTILTVVYIVILVPFMEENTYINSQIWYTLLCQL